jgi:hypothetical protein
MPGPFYFAWVEPNTPYDPAVHDIEDEEVYSFKMSQAEGDFAALSITIRNPRIGLLNPTRKVWLWFSWDDGSAIRPRFNGRLVGLPSDIFAELVTLDFTARPSDFATQKADLAETLKVAPFWSPIFVTEEAAQNPDTVLEARSALWHIDPVTHVVTISDVLVGEDGVIEFEEDDIFEDNISVTMGTPPARSITITSSVPWDNTGTGTVNLDYELVRQWPYANALITSDKHYQLINSYSFAGLVNDWPEAGKNIGKGWSVYSSALRDIGFETAWNDTQNLFPEWVDPNEIFGGPDGTFLIKNWPIEYKQNADGVGGAALDPYINPYDKANVIIIPMGWGRPNLTIQYNASRKYTENVVFTLNTDMQNIVTLPGEDDTILLNVPANSVSENIGGVIPIGDPRRTSFFGSDSGADAIGHLVAIARAHLIIRSRAVKITFQTQHANGVEASLRKNALVHWTKLPGGQALGKITEYAHELDGDTGALTSTITIECAVGRGGSYAAVEGDPTYAEAGYMAAGYQQYENAVSVLPSSDVAYGVVPYIANDDGFNMTKQLWASDVVNAITVEGTPQEQLLAMEAVVRAFDSGAVKNALQQHPTKVTLHLKPATGGPFVTDVTVAVQDLIIPKQIDLEAASA